MKNEIIEINTMLKFEDKTESKKKSHYEIVYSVIKLENGIKEKKALENYFM